MYKTILLAWASCLAALGLSPVLATPPRLIATGWDSPTPARFRAELAAFEALGIFDGTTIVPTRKGPDGQETRSHFAFSREQWQWSEFSECVRDLQAADPHQATHNFLFVYANPGDVDWFDDEGWREVTTHWRLLARAAKEGGLAGLLYDAEPYTKPYSQFCYTAQPERAQHSFEEYCIKARERGRDIMSAVAAEYPDITIMTYRLFCDLLHSVDLDYPRATLEPDTYGLQPAFVDGWCDVMPETIRLVEGNEDAYRFNSPDEFNRAFTRLTLDTPAFLAPENRARFSAQLLVGHGIYLDAHVNPPSSPWHIDRRGGTSAQRLAANVSAALAAANGYVWIYGEKGRWWAGGDPSFLPWNTKLAGAEPALLRARDPRRFAQSLLADADPEANLLTGAAFEAITPEGIPKDWWTWQTDTSQGTYGCSEGMVTLSGMEQGVLGQIQDAETGSTYAVSVQVKSVGRGYAGLTVGWKTAEGIWLHNLRSVFAPDPTVDENGWQDIVGLVDVPDGAGQLVFMLGAQGQADHLDRASFMQPKLRRMAEW